MNRYMQVLDSLQAPPEVKAQLAAQLADVQDRLLGPGAQPETAGTGSSACSWRFVDVSSFYEVHAFLCFIQYPALYLV